MTEAPLTVVTWRWRPTPGYRSAFPVESVNVLRRMVARHFHRPHVFKCVTDDPAGLDPEVEVIPLWSDFANLPSPHGTKKPSCYRRLKAFSPDIAALFGPRFVSLDLDLVLTGDVTPLWTRREPFVIYGDTNPSTHYNGSMFLMTAAARRQVWDRFDPATSPQRARAAGCFGSDQGWISYCLGGGEPKWGTNDGVYSYRLHVAPAGGRLPQDARVVVFHGKTKPWDADVRRHQWLRVNWR